MPETFEEFQATPDQFIDAGDYIVVIGHFRGKSKRGQSLDAPYAHVWHMRSGKAASFHNHVAATPWAEGWG